MRIPAVRRLMKLSSVSSFAWLALAGVGSAQLAAVPEGRTWVRAFGGGGVDQVVATSPASDGGLFLAGATVSFGTSSEAWVMRLDRRGRTIFELALGGAAYDAALAVLATTDGGCIVGGTTTSFGAGGFDGWAAKLDGAGAIQWQKVYQGTEEDLLVELLAPSPDGTYAAGTLVGGLSMYDPWVCEIDPGGDLLWQERFSTLGADFVSSIAPTDQGLVVVANTNSALPGSPGVPSRRPWLLSLDGDGGSLWQRTYVVSGGDAWKSIVPLDDGGFIVAGEVRAVANQSTDVWVVRLDANGGVVWDARFGDPFGLRDDERGVSVRPTATGEFTVLAGTPAPGDGLWVLELDALGNRVWDRTYGFDSREDPAGLELASNGDLLVVARVPVTPLDLDAVVLRLTPDGRGPLTCELGNPTAPNEWSGVPAVASVVLGPVPVQLQTTDMTAMLTAVRSGRGLCASGDE